MTFPLGSVKWDSQVFLTLTTAQLAFPLTEPRTQQEKLVWVGDKEFGHVELEVTAGHLLGNTKQAVRNAWVQFTGKIRAGAAARVCVQTF